MGGNRGGSVFNYIMLTIVLLFITLLVGYWWVFPGLIVIGLIILFLSIKFPAFKKQVNTNINLLITMLLGGLWHGASWQFIIWGGLNGLGLVVYKFWRKISPWEKANHRLAVVWKIAITFTFITFTRVFFRSESMEVVSGMLHQIFSPTALALIPEILISYKWVFLVMLTGFVFHWLLYILKVSK